MRQGKFIELNLTSTDRVAAKKEVEDMCRALLANTVIENFRIKMP